jgi:DME family drug/metabolite transporter
VKQDPERGADPAPSAAGSRARLLGGALLFSTGGAAIKSSSLGGLQLAGLRSALAAAAVLLMAPAAARRLTGRAWLVGLAYGATLLLYVEANKLTTAASTIFLQSTAPLFILLLAPWLLREPLRGRELVFLASLALGLTLFFVDIEPPAALAPRPFAGNVLAAFSSLTWALTIIGLRWLSRSEASLAAGAGSPGTAGAGRAGGSAASAVVAGNLIALGVSVPWLPGSLGMSFADLLTVAYLGFFQIGLAYLLVTSAMRRLPALEASLYLMVEPVLNPLWVWLIHGERPGFWSLLGGTIILFATAAKAGWDFCFPLEEKPNPLAGP